MNSKTMELVFTSYRDSIKMDGLKVSLDYHAPKLCSYPTLLYLIMPATKGLTGGSVERICHVVLDNNWELIRDFINEVHELGINRIMFCDWATKEQIAHGKLCLAGIIGRYIEDKAHRDREFGFSIKIEYGDGREVL